MGKGRAAPLATITGTARESRGHGGFAAFAHPTILAARDTLPVGAILL
jgi:hypothetical protein